MTVPHKQDRYGHLTVVLLLVLASYGLLGAAGWPQRATQWIAREAAHKPVAETSSEANASHPPGWMIAPFVALLAMIALMPLLKPTSHWWESNLHKALVSGGLGLLTLAYYLLLHDQPTTVHWPMERTVPAAIGGPNWSALGGVLANAILGEFLPFIILLFSLYSIAAASASRATCRRHAAHQHADSRRWRRPGQHHRHHRRGDASDPPAAGNQQRTKARQAHGRDVHLHRLQLRRMPAAAGRPAVVLGLSVRRAVSLDLAAVAGLAVRQWRIAARVFPLGPLLVLSSRSDGRHPPRRDAGPPLDDPRPLAQRLAPAGRGPRRGPARSGEAAAGHRLASVGLSAGNDAAGIGGPFACQFGHGAVRQNNGFNFAAIVEVAVLFAGIFLCMQPPLEILHVVGPSLGLAKPAHFFWASGSLSSVLDNAPTYVVFFADGPLLERQRRPSPGCNRRSWPP